LSAPDSPKAVDAISFEQFYIQNLDNLVPMVSIPQYKKYIMSIDPASGNVELEGSELVISSNLTLSEFLSSSAGAFAQLDVRNAPYETYSISLKDSLSTFGVSLVFESQRLDSARLEKITPGSTWANWSQENELEGKSENDKMLMATFRETPHKFPWGEAVSVFDPRSGSAHITIRYSKNVIHS